MGEQVCSENTVTVQAKQQNQAEPEPEVVADGSISFGRFSLDTLSWEKWSTFSHNRYLEEVEKCSTPGSVARKKAYFEAHYRKIGAQRALLQQSLDEEQNHQFQDMGVQAFEPQYQELHNADDPNWCNELDASDPQDSVCEDEVVIHNVPHLQINELQHEEMLPEVLPAMDSLKAEIKNEEISTESCHEDGKVDVFSSQNDETHLEAMPAEVVSITNETKPVIVSVTEDPKLNTIEESVLPKRVQEEDDEKKIKGKEDPKHAINDLTKPKPKKSSLKETASNGHKPSQTKHDKKALATKLSNGNQATNSYPHSVKNPPTVPRKLAKEETISKKKKFVSKRSESKRSASVSLHISLSLGSQRASNITVPQPFELATDRRASIVENLGDKEIVRRAFKAFRHSLPLSGPVTSETPANGTPNATAGSKTPTQETERKHDESARRRMKLVVSKGGEDKHSSLENSMNGKKLNPKMPSTTFSLKSDERAEKRKEFYMKLEEKLNAKEAEKNKIQAKTKEEMEAEIKKLRSRLNFRAAPMPSFYQESTPPKREIKKMPLTRAKSPNLGRKNSDSVTDSNGTSLQLGKGVLNLETKKNNLLEKHANKTDKNGEAPRSTNGNLLSKRNQKKETSTKAANEIQSNIESQITGTPEIQPVDVIGERNSPLKEAYDGPKEGAFDTFKEPSSTKEIGGQNDNLISEAGRSELQSNAILGPEQNGLLHDVIATLIISKKDDVESIKHVETHTGDNSDKVEDCDFQNIVVVQNVYAAQKGDEVTDKSRDSGNEVKAKDKVLQQASSSTGRQDSKDKIAKPAKRERQKAATNISNGKQEASKKNSMRRVMKGGAGLTAFVTDVTVAS